MRAFIAICVVAAAYAEKLGYNYQSGHSVNGLILTPGSISGNSFSGSGISGGVDGGFSGSSAYTGSLSVGSLDGANHGGVLSSLLSSSVGGGFGGSQTGGSHGGNLGGIGSIDSRGLSGSLSGFGVNNGVSSTYSYNAPAEFEKEFYSFSAPEAEFEDANAVDKIASSVKQAIRVIFIKGPENKGLENAALALAKQAGEQKTAIYVLNKQADIGDLANKLSTINKKINNKPEVHFVKYRTSEDAVNAQKAIKSQYDSLGGSSQSHNGGVAPVLNFASQANIRSSSGHIPSNSYLPSSSFRLRS